MVTNHEVLQARLLQGCKQLHLDISAKQIQLLLQYLALLQRWNKAYNLTAITDPLEMVSMHLLDSLSILPFIRGSSVLDIGSGAGLPGLPLAICLPEKTFTLLDSNGKKTRFMQQCKIELQCENLTIEKNRIESYVSSSNTVPQFDTVTCRAFASLNEFYQQLMHISHAESRILAMKGKLLEAELTTIAKAKIVATHKLNVPFIEAERHLIELKK